MKISLSEIWNFIELIEQKEKGWSYSLQASDVLIDNIPQSTLESLKSDTDYNTEILPEIFTFREILWQPDVFTAAEQSLPGLRILKAFCEDTVEEYNQLEAPTHHIYAKLISGLAAHCQEAIQTIETEEGEGVVTRTLGQLRKKCFPIVKFFIYHPQNRLDYYRDAVNRLNYSVKISITQFHGRYTELEDPYWEVSFAEKAPKSKKSTTKQED